MDKLLKQKVLKIQRNELTEYHIYKKLAEDIRNRHYKEVLNRISNEELKHYNFLKNLTLTESKPNRIKVLFYTVLSKLFGLNFSLKLMETNEGIAQSVYNRIYSISADIEEILKDEKKHETELINLLQEDHLKYVSSIVLGLNDALVELSGALVGFTLALQKTNIIAIVGIITGIAAAMSMSVSEFLSIKHEENSDKNPLKASFYTGTAYILTVIILVLPYFIFSNIFLCLASTILNMLLLIFLFTFYVSVAKDLNFKKRFFEMVGISMIVAAVNFGIGLAIRKIFGINV